MKSESDLREFSEIEIDNADLIGQSFIKQEALNGAISYFNL